MHRRVRRRPLGQGVPHYLPGQNPNVEEMTKLWGIPVEAVKGGAETMYPEYRKKLKDTYVRPAKRPLARRAKASCRAVPSSLAV